MADKAPNEMTAEEYFAKYYPTREYLSTHISDEESAAGGGGHALFSQLYFPGQNRWYTMPYPTNMGWLNGDQYREYIVAYPFYNYKATPVTAMACAGSNSASATIAIGIYKSDTNGLPSDLVGQVSDLAMRNGTMQGSMPANAKMAQGVHWFAFLATGTVDPQMKCFEPDKLYSRMGFGSPDPGGSASIHTLTPYTGGATLPDKHPPFVPSSWQTGAFPRIVFKID